MDNSLNDNELKKKLSEDNFKVKVNDLYKKAKEDYDGLNRTNINYENLVNDPDKYKEMPDDIFDPDDPTASSALGAHYQVPVFDRSSRISYMDGRLPGASGPDNPNPPIYIVNEENTNDFGYNDENNYNKPKNR